MNRKRSRKVPNLSHFGPIWPNLVANLTWVILCTQRDHLWFAHGLLTGNNCEQTMSWVDEYWGQQGGHNSAHSGSNVTEWQAYKSGTCSVSHNVLKSKLKKSRICSIWGQSDSLWAQIWESLEGPLYLYCASGGGEDVLSRQRRGDRGQGKTMKYCVSTFSINCYTACFICNISVFCYVCSVVDDLWGTVHSRRSRYYLNVLD